MNVPRKPIIFRRNELNDDDRLDPLCCAERIVGKGGASRVYMGCSEDGKELAVKVLKSSEEVVEEFVSEIEIISCIDHKNAMSLVGFCLEDGKLMLVYDYMRRGSLEELLHGVLRNCRFHNVPLPWKHKLIDPAACAGDKGKIGLVGRRGSRWPSESRALSITSTVTATIDR